jgi:hypothetical protein
MAYADFLARTMAVDVTPNPIADSHHQLQTKNKCVNGKGGTGKIYRLTDLRNRLLKKR